MGNLFDNAKNKKTTTTKKTDKPLINIKGEDFDEKLKLYAKLKKETDEIKTQLSIVQEEIKLKTIPEWCDLYKNKGSYPGSALVTSDSESSYMFVPNDKYYGIDEERASELKDKYGDDIIQEDVTYSFNSNLLEKYAQVISKLIEESDDIDDDDKDNLIIANKKVGISKGTIEKAFSLGDGNVEDFIDEINPIYTLKNPKSKD